MTTRRHLRKRTSVKTGIHPNYVTATVHCSCGETFETRSTVSDIHADVCSKCHPFYTGKQKIMDVGGRVEKFEKRFGKRTPKGGDAPQG
jgi:large subunit ribosomal protein L31